MGARLQPCAAHLMRVRQTFAHAPVLELCFDASQVSIRNHDVFAVYAYKCHTSAGSMATGFGASASSEGVSTYLPPVRVGTLGCERVLQLGSQLFPGVHLKWILGERFKDETSGLAGRVDIPSRLTMVNIPWLTAYLLLVAVEGKAVKTRDPASRAKELLQLMTSLPAFELKAPCAGGSLVINRHGMSGSMHDETFLSAMADACQDAECQSPIPVPLEK